MLKVGFMLVCLAIGAIGGTVISPAIPIIVYYFFSVLRPQAIWQYSLSGVGIPDDFPWSMLVAAVAIGSAVIWRSAYWVAPQRLRGRELPRFTFAHYLFGLFAVWITITYYNAQNNFDAAPWYTEYRKVFIMFFAASLVLVSIRQLWTLYLVATAAFMYIAFEINEIYFTTGYNHLVRQGFAGLDNNGAALMLAMGVPLCIYAWDGIQHWSRWLFVLGLAFIGHAVLLSYSRGAMLTLLVTAPLYIFRCRHKKAIAALYLCGVIAVPVVAGKEITDRFMSIGKHEEDGSAQSRKTTWRIAWMMAEERPFFGYGVRNSSRYTFQFGADEEGRVIHNTYLQIAADSGFGGLTTYVLYLIGGLLAARAVRHRIYGSVSGVSSVMAAGYWLTGGGWSPVRKETGRDDADAQRAYTMACACEGGILAFAFGSFFLSLETFEPPYILCLIAAQTLAVLRRDAVVVGNINDAPPDDTDRSAATGDQPEYIGSTARSLGVHPLSDGRNG